MVSDGAQQMILGVWWDSLFPGLAIVLSVLCFALLGDELKTLFEPSSGRLRR
jgi:peptide/nickel transport system permease protein